MKQIKDLTKKELLDVVYEYSSYVTEECDGKDMQPVCFNEFYQNDYQEIPHIGEKYKIDISICDDNDLAEWLQGFDLDKTIFEITNVDYYGAFSVWIKNCPFVINPDMLVEIN